MPDHNSSDIPLSQQIDEVRGLLLKALKAQLDDLIAGNSHHNQVAFLLFILRRIHHKLQL